ncbi:hypothetical protein FBU30_003221 [Linnemannia zychae]|nr:hypothetical protein FBU30_003221 [Linnemannia zychae]
MNNPISMSDFATDFNYVSKNDAEAVYKDIFSKYIIPQKLRQPLIAAYDIWRRNEGIPFWASQKASIAFGPSASRKPVQIEVCGANEAESSTGEGSTEGDESNKLAPMPDDTYNDRRHKRNIRHHERCHEFRSPIAPELEVWEP